MGYLQGKTVYLCGNIKSTANEDYGVGWRDEITPRLEKHGIIVINPCKEGNGDSEFDQKYFCQLIRERQFVRVKEEFYRVIRKDLRAVDKADFLIYYHQPSLPTVGSLHEAINAVNQKKPLLIMVNELEIDNMNPWLLTLIKPQWLFTKWNDLYAYLCKINGGHLDSSHWW